MARIGRFFSGMLREVGISTESQALGGRYLMQSTHDTRQVAAGDEGAYGGMRINNLR